MASKTQFVKKNKGPTPVFQRKTKDRNRNSTKIKCSKTKQRMEKYYLISILNLASSLKTCYHFHFSFPNGWNTNVPVHDLQGSLSNKDPSIALPEN